MSSHLSLLPCMHARMVVEASTKYILLSMLRLYSAILTTFQLRMRMY